MQYQSKHLRTLQQMSHDSKSQRPLACIEFLNIWSIVLEQFQNQFQDQRSNLPFFLHIFISSSTEFQKDMISNEIKVWFESWYSCSNTKSFWKSVILVWRQIITWISVSRKIFKIHQKISIYFSWNWLTVKVSMSFNMALVRGYSSLRASISSISAKSPWRARFWFVFGMVWMSCAIENIYIVSKIGENYSKILIPVKKSKITCFNVLPNIEGNVWCFS